MHAHNLFKSATNQAFRSSKNFVRLCAGREHVLAASRRAVSASYPPSFASALARMSSTAIAGGVGNGLSGGGGNTLDGGGLARAAMVGQIMEGSEDDDTTRFKRVKGSSTGDTKNTTNQQEPLASIQSGIRSGAADAASAVSGKKVLKAGASSSRTSLEEESEDVEEDVNAHSHLQGSSSSSSSLSNETGKSTGTEGKEKYERLLNDKPYEGPLMDALLTKDGKVLPLNRDDIALFNRKRAEGAKLERGISDKGEPTPAKIAAAQASAIESVFAKRALRASYSQKELDDFVTAVEIQYGRGTLDTDGLTDKFGGTGLAEAKKNLSTRRRDDFRLGEDPLLDQGPQALPFNIRGVTMISNLTWNARPNSNAVDKKATVTAHVSSLGLSKPVCQYMRSIAGPRYNESNDILRISSEKHNDSASNKRECVERLVNLVKEASKLAEKFGPMKVLKKMPAY
jgi:hypothetical protein